MTNQRQIQGVAYKVSGSGPVSILLLRGLGRWSDHWLGFDQRLAERGYRVISVDNRGFGASSAAPLPRGSDIQDLTEDVAAIISKEAPQGAFVVGVSLGGMIALSLAATRPQLVRGLMMINSSVAASKLRRMSGRAIIAVLSALMGIKTGYSKIAAVLLGATAGDAKRQQLAQQWSDIDAKLKPDPWRILWQLKIARRFHGLYELMTVKCPVTVVRSSGDLFVDPANSDFIHRQIKGSSLLSHPTAGHELAFEDPDWLSSMIQNFATETANEHRLV
jgi:pimeloyl-ACP methyl ester carboxylesterase